jgi:hypothetical protein
MKTVTMDNKCVIFVSGLGTTRDYFEPLMSLIPFQALFFPLDNTNAEKLAELVQHVLSLGVTKLYIAPFSISCYITSQIVQSRFKSHRNTISLVLLDPPDAKYNILANIVRSAPDYLLWIWDYVLSVHARYYILAASSGFTTPKIVDMTLAKMPIKTVKSMVKKYLVPFKPPVGTIVLRGSQSKHSNLLTFDATTTYVLPTDHHMVWHKPDLVANFIVYGTIPGQP